MAKHGPLNRSCLNFPLQRRPVLQAHCTLADVNLLFVIPPLPPCRQPIRSVTTSHPTTAGQLHVLASGTVLCTPLAFVPFPPFLSDACPPSFSSPSLLLTSSLSSVRYILCSYHIYRGHSLVSFSRIVVLLPLFTNSFIFLAEMAEKFSFDLRRITKRSVFWCDA